jgi:pyruvate/oxaloacetate carboxyltransferase
MRTAENIVDEYLRRGKSEKYIRIIAGTRLEKLKKEINELLDAKFGKTPLTIINTDANAGIKNEKAI